MGSYRTYCFRVREESKTEPLLKILDELLNQINPDIPDFDIFDYENIDFCKKHNGFYKDNMEA